MPNNFTVITHTNYCILIMITSSSHEFLFLGFARRRGLEIFVSASLIGDASRDTCRRKQRWGESSQVSSRLWNNGFQSGVTVIFARQWFTAEQLGFHWNFIGLKWKIKALIKDDCAWRHSSLLSWEMHGITNRKFAELRAATRGGLFVPVPLSCWIVPKFSKTASLKIFWNQERVSKSSSKICYFAKRHLLVL